MEENVFPAYILSSRAEAEAAISELSRSGVDARKLSIVGSLSALGSALACAGISPDHAGEFELALKAKKTLLIVRGNAKDRAMVNCVLASARDLEKIVKAPRAQPQMGAETAKGRTIDEPPVAGQLR